MPSPEEAPGTVQRARSGDEVAFQQILVRELPALRAWLRVHMPSPLRAHESCSDLVQSVCREVLQGKGEFEYQGAEAFRAWLFTWAKHKLMDRVRYWQADKRLPGHTIAIGEDESLSQVAAVYGSTLSPSGVALRNEELLRLEQAMTRLPEEYREVIGLCRLAGLSREEAGRHLGDRSPGAVRSLLNRALVALSTELERLPKPS